MTFNGTLADAVYLGAFVRYRIELSGGHRLIATSADRAVREKLSVGDAVWCGWSLEHQSVIEE